MTAPGPTPVIQIAVTEQEAQLMIGGLQMVWATRPDCRQLARESAAVLGAELAQRHGALLQALQDRLFRVSLAAFPMAQEAEAMLADLPPGGHEAFLRNFLDQ